MTGSIVPFCVKIRLLFGERRTENGQRDPADRVTLAGMRARPNVLISFLVLVWAGLSNQGFAGPADVIEMQIQPQHVGLSGHVRAGDWLPLKLHLTNHSAQSIRVCCQWLISDGDGDMVVAQRWITLSPQRTTNLWLYAMIPWGTRAEDRWQVRAIDDQKDRILATHTVQPSHLLDSHERIVGLIGPGVLGLQPYFSPITQQEPCRLLRQIEPSQLPDRWYGFSIFESLIWTSRENVSDWPMISPDTQHAVRHWIKRGGHLVVVLADVGDRWVDSPLRDLLPPVHIGEATRDQPPVWLGRAHRSISQGIYTRTLEPGGPGAEKVSILLRDRAERPLVVAWPYGLGRVTLVGVDLNDSRLAQAGLPNGSFFWSAIFGWRSPAYEQADVADALAQRDITGPSFRHRVQLDSFIGQFLDRQRTTSPVLLGATIVLAMYWFLAVPVSFAFLKKRNLTQHSWFLFAGCVVVFSACAWTGAWSWRSNKSTVNHLTLLDAYAGSGMRIHSWLSLYVPHHIRVDVAIRPQEEDQGKIYNTLANPGWRAKGGRFKDRRRYVIAADAPHEARIPIRATAKQLQLTYWQTHTTDHSDWVLPQGEIRLVNGRLDGTLVHRLPGQLRNVLIVLNPGNGQTPRLWRRSEPWRPGERLHFQQHDEFEPLVKPYQDEANRVFKNEGYLGRLIAFKTGRSWNPQARYQATIARSEVVQAIEMLSFYNALPPPDFRNTDVFNRSVQYDRDIGRAFDLTAQTALRSLILIGHLEQGPYPAPLTVNGEAVPAKGWTVVRWITPLARVPLD